MDVSQENVDTLLSMGFPNEGEIRRALQIGKNDISEAIAVLTGDHPTTSFDTITELNDVEMQDVQRRDERSSHAGGSGSDAGGAPVSGPVYGPHLPPTYEEAVQTEQQVKQDEEDMGLTFPVANLYELEPRVFTDSWSIPYKKEESLGKCLLAATKLAKEGLMQNDQYCNRFLEKCMPECFQKLLTSGAVHRWGSDIQEGIYDMIQLLIDLVATHLAYLPVHLDLLHVLSIAFNPGNEFHAKNRARRCDRAHWEEVFGAGQMYAISPPSTSYKEPYGWLVCLINMFAEKDGFKYMKERLESKECDAPTLAALLEPLGLCAEYLNPKIVPPMLAVGMEQAVTFVHNLTENELKKKKAGSVYEMLASMKLLCLSLWTSQVSDIDDLRFDITLRMLKAPHFNARMNALKEITKWLDDTGSAKAPKSAMTKDQVMQWLVENSVLSIALEGNIDQMQYCDKIKNIVDFLGPQLSVDELTKIWKIQNSGSQAVMDNIHSVIAAAGVKFDFQQLEHLFILVQKSWEQENDKIREKLLSLIGKIGKETRIAVAKTRVLELLWDLSHLPVLLTALREQALEEHHAILNDTFIIKEHVKKTYVTKCMDDVKEGRWVLQALKQLMLIAKNIARNSFSKAEKGILQELNGKHNIIKEVTHSMRKFHDAAVQNVKDPAKLDSTSVVDCRYTHKDYVMVHLNFLQYFLQESDLYLLWNRVREIWDTLIANPNACLWDRETCFEWFTKGFVHLDPETQSLMFQKEFLRLDPAKLTSKGFHCFKCLFENVNQYEHKLKKTGITFNVEKTDLIGLDCLWEICLNTPDSVIAEIAISMLMNMSYTSLSPRIKRDPLVLHKKFIDDCYKRLETAMIPLGGSAVAQALSQATRLLMAVSVPEGATAPPPSKSANLVNIERLLLIAERYIVTVEELHTTPRTILPHGASFTGQPMNIFVVCESQKMEFELKTHTNESVGSIRHKIAFRLKSSPDQVQIVSNDKMLTKDHKLLHQLSVEDNQVVNARCNTSLTYFSGQDTPSTPTKVSFDLEQEKQLPGVVMATGGQVFEMLYQLADLDEPRITTQARSLLQLIPTDPSITDSLDSLTNKIHQPSPEASPRLSPRASPRKLMSAPTPTPTPPPHQNSPPRQRQTTKETLKGLFDNSALNMSTFRILYNLEVLSSKLMPTIRDAGTTHSAKKYSDEFLEAGGLHLVVGILQRDAMPAEVDYETRQGCYIIALQLLRYLLCGQEVVPDTPRRGSTGSAVGMAALPPGGSGSVGSGSGPISLELTPPAASKSIQHPHILRTCHFDIRTQPEEYYHEKLILYTSWREEDELLQDCTYYQQKYKQTMGVNDFTETVACFLRVTWAAAAGRLHLAGHGQPHREGTMSSSFLSSGSSRSSTGSSASTGSESEGHCLHPGVCVKQTVVSPRDTNIAKEALELLVTCLQLRSQLLAVFYTLPCVSDFIIDVLVGSPQGEVRDVALDQFYLLSQTEVSPMEAGGHQQQPHHFMLQTLLKARLPFWVSSSSSTRGASYRVLRQCKQYFDLRCRLLAHLTEREQQQLQINVRSMLEDELDWLANFMPSENLEVRVTDNLLIAGHLRLIKTLLTCFGVDKRGIGGQLVHDVLHDFLFPASKIIKDTIPGVVAEDNCQSYVPKCSSCEARLAAYELLVETADACLENLSKICDELISMHHAYNPEMASQWEYMPPVDSRAKCGFVGLKNGGATCYMNALLQQLFMSPGIPETILQLTSDECDEESVLYQTQQVFGHLLESKLQYYVPENFWKVFKLWGQPVNIREQQDALDFYQAIIDQCDEQIKKLGRDPVFKKTFQGIYSDQKICQGCPHRFEREEVFFALNVTVKNTTLQDSLDQFVKGELLEGDNSYFCEKCGEKRNTIKRMCIKTLPPVLCIQLKRFDYDWEANRALKFDDYFKFPWVLDMEPYTAEGMALRDEQQQQQTSAPETDSNSSSSTEDESPVTFISMPISHQSINYELVGVVVHSGQANAGHYYSFIKDRRGTHATNPQKGKWYKFNDTIVEEFEMSDASLEAECFGGKYKPKTYDQSTSYQEERLRFWNGYLLLYERQEDVKTPVSAKKSKVSIKHPSFVRQHSVKRTSRNDSLVELSELVHKGEKKGLFPEKMPVRIQQGVREENLKFMKNRDIYDVDYFHFIRILCDKNKHNTHEEQYTQLCVQSVQLAIKFLFNTYFRTKKKLRLDVEEWVLSLSSLLQRCKEACMWLVTFLSQDSACFKTFLLECPSREIRATFGKLLEKTMATFFQHGGVSTHKCFDEIVEQLLTLLNKDVPDLCKHCSQYFQVLDSYTQLGTKACGHLFMRHGFHRLALFLLGPTSTNSDTSNEQESGMRRWSSSQARDFGPLHAALATLVLNCDIAPQRSHDPENIPIQKPETVSPQVFLKLSAEMEKYVFGAESSCYIREVVLALREVTSNTDSVQDMLVYCSFCNHGFTTTVIRNIMIQCATAPSNELRTLFQVLMTLLCLPDPLQRLRLQWVIDGFEDEDQQVHEGIIAITKGHQNTDSRRSYQCVKFLVSLSTKCPEAKSYLLKDADRWQWAVSWLEHKMSDYYWTAPTSNSVSNEDSSSKLFQRTMSAQVKDHRRLKYELQWKDVLHRKYAPYFIQRLATLAEANALLTECRDQSDMEISEENTDTDDTQLVTLAFDSQSTVAYGDAGSVLPSSQSSPGSSPQQAPSTEPNEISENSQDKNLASEETVVDEVDSPPKKT